jgi:hypothetical protein
MSMYNVCVYIYIYVAPRIQYPFLIFFIVSPGGDEARSLSVISQMPWHGVAAIGSRKIHKQIE